MNRTIKKIHCAAYLMGVSCLALSVSAAIDAQAQQQEVPLPAVTVDPPKRQTVRRAQPQKAAKKKATAPRVAAPMRPTEPIPYVTPRTGALGAPPPPYAGGQVATGSRLGMLGNRSVMDTPFSQTSYTAKLIQDQQARTVGDVLQNDPSVRVKTPAGNGVDGLYIRGFYYDSGDYSLNGLYGIAPQYSAQANYLDRVEVLKGPGALLNGMPPAGAVGGSVNLVTKSAPDFDITQLTATYASKSQFGTNIDLSRRFGEHKEFGVRFNGGYRNGSTAYDRQTDELGNAVLNFDYRGERVRFSTDIGYQTENLSPPLRFLTFTSNPPFPTPTIPTPPAPRPGTNYMPSWANWKTKDTFAMTRGEVDLTESVTAYGAFGYHKSDVDYIYTSPRITNRDLQGNFVLGNWQANPFAGNDTYESYAGEVGVRASVDTGPINHLLTVNYSAVHRDYSAFARGSGPIPIISNLYNPPPIPFPTFTSVVQNQKTQTQLSSVGFADTMSMLNNRLQFIAGARRQTASVDSFNLLPGSTNSSADDSIWTPGFAAIVKPVEFVSLYANYIEGLKAPQVVTTRGIFSNLGEILPAYRTKQKEVGVKVDLGRVIVTASVFDIMMPNLVAVAVQGQQLPAQRLSGEQRNRGIELDVFGEITPTVRILGGVTLIDGELVKQAVAAPAPTIPPTVAVTNFNGKTPVGVSAVNVNFGAEWDTPFVDGLTLTGRVIYTSESYADEANTQKLPAWTRVDLGARYTFASPWNGKPIVIRANIENVFNEAYWNSYRTVSSAVSLGAPRTYLLSSTFNF